jgi:hypothetical protein
MKIIDRVGIAQVLREMRARGEKLRYGSSKKDAAAVAAKNAKNAEKVEAA